MIVLRRTRKGPIRPLPSTPALHACLYARYLLQFTPFNLSSQAGRCCSPVCAESRNSSQALKPERLRGPVGQAVRKVSAMLGQLLSLELRRTTLLLLFIWWANAVVYYGLVLLATTVSSAVQPASCSSLVTLFLCICM